MSDSSAPIPAATVIIVRDTDDGHEVLMVERHRQLVFAGGAVVFPGGRIDTDDRLLAHAFKDSLQIDQEEAAGRVAAIRESLEETGIAVGIKGLAQDQWSEWRKELLNGRLLSNLLDLSKLKLDLEALTPFARWLPNFKETRIFDTRFYLTRAPVTKADTGSADGYETTRLFWTSPQQIIADADQGNAQVIFPTRRNLERLASFRHFEELRSHALETGVRTITPWIEDINGEPWLSIPDDLGYPIVSEPLAKVRRT